MKLNRSKKGFTLVEIMIVVVIIGLLAAMGIPAFQKVRRESITKTMVNDARQLGAAFQQIGTEYTGIVPGTTTITVELNAATGIVTQTGAVTLTGYQPIPAETVPQYVRKVSVGYDANVVYTFRSDNDPAFRMSHPQVAPRDANKQSTVNTSTTPGDDVAFDSEGRAL
jgi:type IV pilus assembly protein PilA